MKIILLLLDLELLQNISRALKPAAKYKEGHEKGKMDEIFFIIKTFP